MTKKYIDKKHYITAAQWKGDNLEEIYHFLRNEESFSDFKENSPVKDGVLLLNYWSVCAPWEDYPNKTWGDLNPGDWIAHIINDDYCEQCGRSVCVFTNEEFEKRFEEICQVDNAGNHVGSLDN